MRLELVWQRGCHPSRIAEYFNETEIPCFLRSGVLSWLFGSGWISVLIYDADQHAMLKTLVMDGIGNTGFCDAIDWVGYRGALFSKGSTAGFRQSALIKYSRFCRHRGIVAELIRFDPRDDQIVTRVRPRLSFYRGRSIIYAPAVSMNTDEQVRVYAPSCRRQIRSAEGRVYASNVDKSTQNIARFRDLYVASMQRCGAVKRWFFDESFFQSMSSLSEVNLWFATDCTNNDLLLSAIATVDDGKAITTLLVANHDKRSLKGANDLLTHEVVRSSVSRGFTEVCLGGGGLNRADDPLERFKRKFSGGTMRPLMVGIVIHSLGEYQQLCRLAKIESQSSDGISVGDEFLRKFFPYRINRQFWNVSALFRPGYNVTEV